MKKDNNKQVLLTTRIILELDAEFLDILRNFSPDSKMYKDTAREYEDFLNQTWGRLQ